MKQFLNVDCALLRNLNAHAKFRNWNRTRLQPLPRLRGCRFRVTRYALKSTNGSVNAAVGLV
jgi:hypothetical protein